MMLTNKAPKFGNDDDYADRWTVEIDDFLGRTYRNEFKCSRYGKGPIPGSFSLSLSSVTAQRRLRQVRWRDARRAQGEGRRSTTESRPATGPREAGPTAVINSEGKLPSIWFQKGSIFNMRLSADALTSSEGRNRVLALIKRHFKNDQYHVQFNVLNDETLIDAQKHPEEYRDLMVRIAGIQRPLHTPEPRAPGRRHRPNEVRYGPNSRAESPPKEKVHPRKAAAPGDGPSRDSGRSCARSIKPGSCSAYRTCSSRSPALPRYPGA